MNKHDTTAGTDIYDMLKAKANKIKDPELKAKALKSAEKFAQVVAGE